MNPKKYLIIALSSTVGIILSAGITLVILKSIGSGGIHSAEAGDSKTVNDVSDLQKAETLEKEANELIEMNPKQAKDKYLQAMEAYENASDSFKAGEMRDNASTAEANNPPEEPTESQVLNSGGQ